MSEHILKNFYKVEKTPKSLKFYLKESSNNNTWKRITTLEGLEGFSEQNIEKLIEIFQEGFESPVVRKKKIHGVELRKLDKDLEIIQEIIEDERTSNFEKSFLIMLINNTIEDSDHRKELLDFLKKHFNREKDLPNNYYSWSEKDAIFSILPVIKNNTYELFGKLSTLDESSDYLTWSLHKYDYLLRTIDFFLNDKYSDSDLFEEAFENEEIPEYFEISDKAILRIFNWMKITSLQEIINISKKFLMIITEKDFDPAYFYDRDIELINNRIFKGIVPAFFDKKDGVYFDAGGESMSMFSDVAMSVYYTTDEMELIEKDGKNFQELFNNIPYGEVDRKDAHWLIPEFVQFSLDVGLQNFIKICDWFIKNISPKLPKKLSKDMVWVLRREDVANVLREKSQKKNFEKFLESYLPEL